MKTKNLVAILCIGVISLSTASAQQQHKQGKTERPERTHKPGSEEFKSMKIAYLSEKLSLTPAEAEKFWPIYNEYDSKKVDARKDFREDKKEQSKEVEISDAEIEKMLNQRIELKQTELNLEKEYLTKFKSVLSIKKVAELYKAEDNFKRELLRKMRDTPRPTPPQKPVAPTTPVGK